MSMKVLCAGDLHLGRGSTRFSATVGPRTISCVSAWNELVDCAIARHADLVALSGDVVDQDNRYYESLGPLERGLRRLGQAGIPTVAVAGNHDYKVLPELARTLPKGYFTLLGAGGVWERATFTARDGTKLHVDGWSFPARHVDESPVHHYPTSQTTDDIPVLGVLHADLDAPASRYGPVTRALLQAQPVAMWLLGHIHASTLVADPGAPLILYPGSPQAMDPSETDVHGAWLVDLGPGRAPTPCRIPLSSIRYATLDVDITAATDVSTVRATIVDCARDFAERAIASGGPLRCLSLRMTLSGRTTLHRQLRREAMLAQALDVSFGGVDIFIERVDVTTRPDRNLAQLAKGTDAASLLAQLLLALDTPDGLSQYPELSHAMHDATSRILSRGYGARYSTSLQSSSLRSSSLDGHAASAMLARQATSLLDELLSQQENES